MIFSELINFVALTIIGIIVLAITIIITISVHNSIDKAFSNIDKKIENIIYNSGKK